MKNEKKIIIFMYGDIKEYPPTINAINILAERGWDVTVLNLKETNTPTEINKKVTLKYLDNLTPGIRNIFNFIKSTLLLTYYTIKLNPSQILSYDGMSVFPSFIASKLTKTKWVYHQHDFWQKPKGWLRFPFWCEYHLTKYAYRVTFPQPERALLFEKQAKFKKKIEIIYNGPRLNWTKNSQAVSLIKTLKKDDYSILIYQGGWAKRFSIQNIINAISKTKKLAFIILGKPLEKGIRSFYESIIEKKNLNNNVFLIETISYFKLPNYTNFCDIGIANFTFNKSETVNNLLLAGASNKIIEYCACALPILAPHTPTNKTFIEKAKRGLVCNPEDPDDIANKINELLSKKRFFSEKNRVEFNRFLNFDIQFEKMIKILETDD